MTGLGLNEALLWGLLKVLTVLCVGVVVLTVGEAAVGWWKGRRR